MENLVTLCAKANDQIESDSVFAAAAHDLGLVCKWGDTPRECWERMRANGLVR